MCVCACTCVDECLPIAAWETYQWPQSKKDNSSPVEIIHEKKNHLMKRWDLDIVYPIYAGIVTILVLWRSLQSLWRHGCISHVVARRQHFRVHLPILQLFHPFGLLFHSVPWALVVDELTLMSHLGLSTWSIILFISSLTNICFLSWGSHLYGPVSVIAECEIQARRFMTDTQGGLYIHPFCSLSHLLGDVLLHQSPWLQVGWLSSALQGLSSIFSD